MKSKAFGWAVPMLVVVLLAAGSGSLAQNSVLAQNSRAEKFSGMINAYSPQTSTGPYEVRGPWSLELKRDCGKADFSAALNMELSDGWVITKNNMNFDPNARNAHTHHITLVNADVTKIPNGFRVMGTATVTLNGGPTPFLPSVLTIDITGGKDIEFSNITLTFQNPAATHFGAEALPGVVRRVEER